MKGGSWDWIQRDGRQVTKGEARILNPESRIQNPEGDAETKSFRSPKASQRR
jgi:hypothetical protein